MNRREILKRIAGAATVAGGVVTPLAVSWVAAEPMPALVIFEVSDPYALDLGAFFASWQSAVVGTPFEHVRAIVLESGMKMSVLSADGRVLNERIETEKTW